MVPQGLAQGEQKYLGALNGFLDCPGDMRGPGPLPCCVEASGRARPSTAPVLGSLGSIFGCSAHCRYPFCLPSVLTPGLAPLTQLGPSVTFPGVRQPHPLGLSSELCFAPRVQAMNLGCVDLMCVPGTHTWHVHTWGMCTWAVCVPDMHVPVVCTWGMYLGCVYLECLCLTCVHSWHAYLTCMHIACIYPIHTGHVYA